MVAMRQAYRAAWGAGGEVVAGLSAAREMARRVVAVEEDGRDEQDDLGSKNDPLAPSGALKEHGLRYADFAD